MTLSGRHLGSAVGLAQERNRLGRTPVSPESAAVQVRRFQQFPGSLYSAPRQRYISHEMGLLGTTQAHHDHRQRPEHDDDVSSLRAHLTPRDTLRALATPHMRGARIGGHPGLYGWVLGMYVIHTFKNERLQSTRICNKPLEDGESLFGRGSPSYKYFRRGSPSFSRYSLLALFPNYKLLLYL